MPKILVSDREKNLVGLVNVHEGEEGIYAKHTKGGVIGTCVVMKT